MTLINFVAFATFAAAILALLSNALSEQGGLSIKWSTRWENLAIGLGLLALVGAIWCVGAETGLNIRVRFRS